MPCLDLNGDQQITVADVLIEASYNGQTVPPAPVQADFDADGDVDGDDAAFYYQPPYHPWPNEPVTCQDTPIGPAGAVGGETRLASVMTPNDGGPATGWWLAPVGALALASLVSARLFLATCQR